MKILKQKHGHIYQCASDDGLVVAKQCPTTTGYGRFCLYDTSTDRPMTRGHYEDYSRPIAAGTMTDERVPNHIWASAAQLMSEWTDYQRQREDDMERKSTELYARRHTALSETISADMDRPDSDL